MDGPVEHVIRVASFPWRPPEDQLTECGQVAASHTSLTRDEMRTKVKVQGIQRAALSTCMTCLTVAARSKTWEEDPVAAVRRIVHAGRDDQFRAELWAIAALIDRHRDEFQGYLDGLAQTTDLTQRRQAKKRKTR